MNDQVKNELPQYQCHKKVRALKISSVIGIQSESLTSTNGPEDDGAMLYFDSIDGALPNPITVEQRYIDKHRPEAGGYYVVYEDGYESFSPSGAFEAGYTLIE